MDIKEERNSSGIKKWELESNFCFQSRTQEYRKKTAPHFVLGWWQRDLKKNWREGEGERKDDFKLLNQINDSQVGICVNAKVFLSLIPRRPTCFFSLFAFTFSSCHVLSDITDGLYFFLFFIISLFYDVDLG